MDTDAVATGNVKDRCPGKGRAKRRLFGGSEILAGPKTGSTRPAKVKVRRLTSFFMTVWKNPTVHSYQTKSCLGAPENDSCPAFRSTLPLKSSSSSSQRNGCSSITIILDSHNTSLLFSRLNRRGMISQNQWLTAGLQVRDKITLLYGFTSQGRSYFGRYEYAILVHRSIEVRGSQKMQLEEVLLYPNPTSDRVNFEVMHNRPGENLILNLKVFSSFGGEIFSLQRRFPKAERSIMDIQWIFLQSKTKYPAKGTYLYEINLQSEEDGASERKGGKIIIQ